MKTAIQKQILWDKYIKNSPKNVLLTNEDIMNEMKAVRDAKAQKL
jgi:hypothetical protein